MADRDRLRPDHDLHLAGEIAPGGEAAELAAHGAGLGGAGQHVGLAEELGHPARAGAVVDLLGRAGLDHAPVAQHGDRVGQRERLGLVVGDEQGAGAGGAQDRGDLTAQRLAQAGVERGERLVEQDHLGVGRERARERDPLALAAGELVRVGLRPAGEPDQIERLADALAPCGAEAHVGGHVEVREQRALLEDHADPALLRLHPLAARGDRAAADPDRPGVGALEARDHAQQRRLARAARPEQRHELAAADPQAGAVDRPQGAEGPAQALGFDGARLAHGLRLA